MCRSSMMSNTAWPTRWALIGMTLQVVAVQQLAFASTVAVVGQRLVHLEMVPPTRQFDAVVAELFRLAGHFFHGQISPLAGKQCDRSRHACAPSEWVMLIQSVVLDIEMNAAGVTTRAIKGVIFASKSRVCNYRVAAFFCRHCPAIRPANRARGMRRWALMETDIAPRPSDLPPGKPAPIAVCDRGTAASLTREPAVKSMRQLHVGRGEIGLPLVRSASDPRAIIPWPHGRRRSSRGLRQMTGCAQGTCHVETRIRTHHPESPDRN